MNIDFKQYLNLNWYERLSEREKKSTLAGGAFFIVFLIVVLVVIPINAKRSSLDKSISAKQKQLSRMYEYSGTIKALKGTISPVSRSRGFSLFSFLEAQANRLRIRDRIDYMRPVKGGTDDKQVVEVRIKGLFTDELIGILHGIETCTTPLVIKRFSLRRIEKGKNIDVTLQVQVQSNG